MDDNLLACQQIFEIEPRLQDLRLQVTRFAKERASFLILMTFNFLAGYHHCCSIAKAGMLILWYKACVLDSR
jgi:hypothetical protein